MSCVNTVQYSTVQYSTVQHCTSVLHSVMSQAVHSPGHRPLLLGVAQPHPARCGVRQQVINSTAQYSTAQYSTAQYSTVQYSTVQYSTVQYSTVQYSTVQYSTAQYSTVQYSAQYIRLELREPTDPFF